jgi:two-component system response regulator YesN
MGYRVIIADDEPKIIELIRQLGHWEELGIEIIEECHTGRQAYESIIEKCPDFVLSDIKMPGYDGIELIRKVRERNPDPLFVLISGYRHFEYARSAISLNVIDYLLKPIDAVQLNETLTRVCRRIDQLRSEKEEQAEISQLKDANTRRQMEAFWEVFLTPALCRKGLPPTEELCNSRYHTDFSPGCYQMICIYSNLSAVLGRSDSMSSTRVDTFIRDTFRTIATVYYHTTYMGIMVALNFSREQEKEIHKRITALYYNIRDLSELYGEFRLNFGVSSVKYSVSELTEAFVEAHAAEWGRLVLMRNEILEYRQISSLPHFKQDELVTQEERRGIRECVRYLRKEELSDIYEHIYRRAAKLGNSHPDDILNAFFTMQYDLSECYDEGEARERFLENFYYAYLNGNTFLQVIKNTYLVLEKDLEEAQKQLKEKKGKPITMALRYMKENYGKQISLEEVAAAGNVSGNYLSRLFKDEMEIGFNDYLTQLRIEESQKLLSETNLPVKEIAIRVGYLDEKYYSKLFKKSTGIKPTEYRRIYS